MKFLVGNVHLARWPTLNKALSLPRSSHRKPFLWNYSTHVIRQFSTSGKCCAPHERNVLKTRVPTVKAFGFRELGIHDVVSSSLETAYPDVKRPTLSQADFIPAILQGKDVLLHDATGTGKSFGVILSLLSKRRVTRRRTRESGQESVGITSLVIVPHRDLAFQMLHWIKSIIYGSSSASLDSFAQVAARDSTDPVSAQISRLRHCPPHVLIGTPQALNDIYTSDASALQLDTLSTIYVDEVDYLIGVPAPHIRKSSEERAWRNFKRHPSVTRLLLDGILREHGRKTLVTAPLGCKAKKTMGAPPHVQLVMSSATVHENLVEYLTEEGWLDEAHIYVSGKEVAARNSFLVEEFSTLTEVIHHALVVHRSGKVYNLQEVQLEEKGEESRSAQEIFDEANDASLQQQKLETVATIFAMDVPKQALLVLPPNASVQIVVSKMQEFGVNAQAFDVRALNEATEDAIPTLLVATPTHTRGVDLPALSHVFVLGVPDVGDIDVFKHIAGRVDRFGNGGTVVVLLGEVQKEMKDGMLKITKNEPNLMKIFYRKLGLKTTNFDLSRLDFQVGDS